MNTPAHLLLGAAAFGRGGDRRVIWGALAGAFLPDLSLYVLAGVSLFVLGIEPRIVFDDLYYSASWQSVFAVDNSFFLWGMLLAVALWQRSRWGMALTAAALLHLVLDFPLHHDDGRPHFWPFSGWVFESPVSYWDRGHHAGWVVPVAAVISMISASLIWMRRPGIVLSLLTGLLVVAEMRTAYVWMYIFSGG